MKATLLERPDEHHWVLLEYRVTQLAFDARAVRLLCWSLEGSAEVRLAAPFIYAPASGAARTLDPSASETLAPLLGRVRSALTSLTVTRDGELAVGFGDGARIVAASTRADAWEVQGAGLLEGMTYRADAGAMS